MTAGNSTKKRKKSGIPTGNAGEYFVMGELLRRGYAAQLADRNTQGYDLLVGQIGGLSMQTVQVKTVRQQPWFVRVSDFDGQRLDQITIYVLLGAEDASDTVKFFVTRNRDLLGKFHQPPRWQEQGQDSAFMSLKNLVPFENRWDSLIDRC